MPLVIDADSASTLAAGRCASSRRILSWIRGGGIVHSGGKLQKELGQTPLKDLLAAWSAAGRLRIFPTQEIENEAELISQLASSNDDHVLAVVKIGGARILITGDQLLKDDMKNHAIVAQPRKIISCRHGVMSKLRIVDALLAQFG